MTADLGDRHILDITDDPAADHLAYVNDLIRARCPQLSDADRTDAPTASDPGGVERIDLDDAADPTRILGGYEA